MPQSKQIRSGTQGQGSLRLFCFPYNVIRARIKNLIQSFRCAETEKLFRGYRTRRFQAIGTVARRKLRMLDAATSLADLATIPGNSLEGLKRDRIGQHSIRVNDRYRLCFVFKERDAEEVEIVDYH